MIVCVCEGVSEREVRAAIQRGADNLQALGQACRAGTGCGRCRQHLVGMLRERVAARDDERPAPPADGGMASA
ncbi:MAG: (2Fe-2S)-binding protein [Deltaproteobacteria bacterium HGW-Deltaproteobacteria-14]|jgi:bacterioferritin-associated ferredoxin|nr:MAG: (2Fe-2S)-binding protein [Deltaproteobacteria bacterium HGW-Deltaproteobacteria-14]